MADDNVAVGQEDVGLNGGATGAEGGEDGDVARVVVVAVDGHGLDLVQRVKGPRVERSGGTLTDRLRGQSAAGEELVDGILLRRHFTAQRMVRDAVVANLPRSALGVLVGLARALATGSAESREVLGAVCR